MHHSVIHCHHCLERWCDKEEAPIVSPRGRSGKLLIAIAARSARAASATATPVATPAAAASSHNAKRSHNLKEAPHSSEGERVSEGVKDEHHAIATTHAFSEFNRRICVFNRPLILAVKVYPIVLSCGSTRSSSPTAAASRSAAPGLSQSSMRALSSTPTAASDSAASFQLLRALKKRILERRELVGWLPERRGLERVPRSILPTFA